MQFYKIRVASPLKLKPHLLPLTTTKMSKIMFLCAQSTFLYFTKKISTKFCLKIISVAAVAVVSSRVPSPTVIYILLRYIYNWISLDIHMCMCDVRERAFRFQTEVPMCEVRSSSRSPNAHRYPLSLILIVRELVLWSKALGFRPSFVFVFLRESKRAQGACWFTVGSSSIIKAKDKLLRAERLNSSAMKSKTWTTVIAKTAVSSIVIFDWYGTRKWTQHE